MPGGRRSGYRAERELAHKLWEHGFAVVRGPASGAGARHLVYPDLVAIREGRVYVFEVKYRAPGTKRVYIDSGKLNRLLEFCKRARAQLLVAVKRRGDGWLVIKVNEEMLSEAAGKTLGLSLEEGIPLETFIREALHRPLDSYAGVAEETSAG